MYCLPLLALMACAENDKKIHEKIITQNNFNYSAPEKRAINLSQVFDNRKDTIFVFNGEASDSPEISELDSKHVVIPVKQEGNYWILHDCVMRELKVSVNNTFVTVKNNAFVPKPIPTDPKLAKHFHPEYSYCGYLEKAHRYLKHHHKTATTDETKSPLPHKQTTTTPPTQNKEGE